MIFGLAYVHLAHHLAVAIPEHLQPQTLQEHLELGRPARDLSLLHLLF